MNTAPLETRFWKKVHKTKSCWLWLGSQDDDGYGRIKLGAGYGKKSRITTHRLSYKIHKGEIPIGLLVLHKCDVPNCVNPEHLFLGTAADNTEDMIKKNRNAFGERNGSALRTTEQVLKIRRRYRERTSQIINDIAKELAIKPSSVWDIVRGRIWKHLS